MMTAPRSDRILQPMKKRESLALEKEIRRNHRRNWTLILELHERRAWIDRGYRKLETYVEDVWRVSRETWYRWVHTGKLIHHVSQDGMPVSVEGLSEKMVRGLGEEDFEAIRTLIQIEAEEDGEGKDVSLPEIISLYQGQLESREKDEDFDLEPPAPAKRDAVGTPTARPDTATWIAARCETCRGRHQQLGDRAQAADAALDSYLNVVRGE